MNVQYTNYYNHNIEIQMKYKDRMNLECWHLNGHDFPCLFDLHMDIHILKDIQTIAPIIQSTKLGITLGTIVNYQLEWQLAKVASASVKLKIWQRLLSQFTLRVEIFARNHSISYGFRDICDFFFNSAKIQDGHPKS